MTFSTYTVLPHRKDYITQIGLRTPDGELISDQINMVIIELDKLEEIIRKSVDDMTSMEMWSVFLGMADKPKHRQLINEIMEKKEALSMAGAVLTSISKDEHERAKFLSRRKAETDRISNLLTERDNGRKEAMTEVARAMKAEGIQLDAIMRFTKLSSQEIAAL